MKNYRKALLLVLCAVLLVAASVLGTLAYLTDTKSATNTFTVGHVYIDLDETDVNPMGVKDGDTRVTENTYHLLPNHTYVKDPIVYVEAKSDDCFVFVKIDNEIADIEDETTVATQITAKGWTQLTDKNDNEVAGVYYKNHTKQGTRKEYPVFENFKIKGTVDNTELADYQGKTIVVTAYAIQADGFNNDAFAAWTAGGIDEGGWDSETPVEIPEPIPGNSGEVDG